MLLSPLPTQLSDGFPPELWVQEPQTELRTLGKKIANKLFQSCEQYEQTSVYE